MSISSRIYEPRHALGLTQGDIATACGVSITTVHKWENGVIDSMRADKIQKLAAVLNVTIPYLLDGIDKPTAIDDYPIRKNMLSAEEKELLRIYQALSVKDKVRLLSVAIELEDAAQV